jgi:hypothetical protein
VCCVVCVCVCVCVCMSVCLFLSLSLSLSLFVPNPTLHTPTHKSLPHKAGVEKFIKIVMVWPEY